MPRVGVLRMLLLAGAAVLATGMIQRADRGIVRSIDAEHLAAAPLRAPAVLRLVRPRPGARLHMAFPRTWRPLKLEVGSPVERPPLRVFCATCPPGTMLEVDL